MILFATLLLMSQPAAAESQGLHFICEGICKTTSDGPTRALPIAVECWIDVNSQRVRVDISRNGVRRESLVLTADSAFACRYCGARWTTVDSRGNPTTSGNWPFLVPFFMFTDRPTGNRVLPGTFFSQTPRQQVGSSVQRNAISGYVSRVEYIDDHCSLEIGIGAAKGRDGLELKEVEIAKQEESRTFRAEPRLPKS